MRLLWYFRKSINLDGPGCVCSQRHASFDHNTAYRPVLDAIDLLASYAAVVAMG